MLFGLGTCKRDNNYSFVKLFDYNNVAKDRKITGIYFLMIPPYSYWGKIIEM